MDNVREDPKEKNFDLTRIGEATRNREIWRSLIVSTLMEEKKRRRIRTKREFFWERRGFKRNPSSTVSPAYVLSALE